MGGRIQQSASAGAWTLAKEQHGVITRKQLRELGFSRRAIEHRIKTGRLHVVWRGVYAVGRHELSQLGRWMAAVLACGPDAVLSHASAAELWEIRSSTGRAIHVSAIASYHRRLPGITVHRRIALGPSDITRHRRILTTTPACTIIDIATGLKRDELVAAVNAADSRGLVNPDDLRAAVEHAGPRRGVAPLSDVLDRDTFALTDSELERRFLPIARRAGLPLPETQRRVNGFRVDFYWPGLGLVVETDGLRYHRTPAQQARDRLRDQTHTAAGLVPLRFTRAQVRFEPNYVEQILRAVQAQLLN
jgi:very-short-patch-repair endonuclease